MNRKSHSQYLKLTPNEQRDYLAHAKRGSHKKIFIETSRGTEIRYRPTIFQVVVSKQICSSRREAVDIANQVLQLIKQCQSCQS